jgi:ABC-type Fe3+ transport system permease subunit
MKTNVSMVEINTVTFETIGKFAIPLVIGTTFVVTSVSLLYAYSYGHEVTNDSANITLLAAIFIVITIFSAIIFMLIKNIGRFLSMKTKEIENQKQGLEVMLGKKI